MNETVLIQADILPCYCPVKYPKRDNPQLCELCAGFIKSEDLPKKKKSKTI